ncbi:unnamed protein product, partial [Cuscuta campestris]
MSDQGILGVWRCHKGQSNPKVAKSKEARYSLIQVRGNRNVKCLKGSSAAVYASKTPITGRPRRPPFFPSMEWEWSPPASAKTHRPSPTKEGRGTAHFSVNRNQHHLGEDGDPEAARATSGRLGVFWGSERQAGRGGVSAHLESSPRPYIAGNGGGMEHPSQSARQASGWRRGPRTGVELGQGAAGRREAKVGERESFRELGQPVVEDLLGMEESAIEGLGSLLDHPLGPRFS